MDVAVSYRDVKCGRMIQANTRLNSAGPALWQHALRACAFTPGGAAGLPANLPPQPWARQPDFPLRVPRGFAARMKKADPLRSAVPPGLAASGRGDPHGRVQCGCGRRSAVPQRRRRHSQVPRPRAADRHRRLRGPLPLLLPPALSVRRRIWRPAIIGSDALETIAADTSITEVILSGGDPLSLTDDKLAGFAAGAGVPAACKPAALAHPPAGRAARTR